MHIASFVEKDASFAVIVYVHSGNYFFVMNRKHWPRGSQLISCHCLWSAYRV